MLNTQWNTPQALYPIKGVAGAAAIFFFSSTHRRATCVMVDLEQRWTGCVTGGNAPAFANWTVLLFSLMNGATVWPTGLFPSMVHCWLGPVSVCEWGHSFHCLAECRWVTRAFDIGWLGASLVRLWRLFWYLAFIRKCACVCSFVHLVLP